MHGWAAVPQGLGRVSVGGDGSGYRSGCDAWGVWNAGSMAASARQMLLTKSDLRVVRQPGGKRFTAGPCMVLSRVGALWV